MRSVKTFLGWVGGVMLSFNAAAQQRAPAPDFEVDAPRTVQDSLDVPPAAAPVPAAIELCFYNIHTKERHVLRHIAGNPVDSATTWFLRDYRRGEVTEFSPRLFDLLCDMQKELNRRYPDLAVEFHVISGYRTAATNDQLRGKGGTQAKKSHHIEGEAIDIRVPGVKPAVLRDIATCLGYGGVGYYAADNFVHVDVGPVRYWPSRDYLAKVKCP